ncbi:MAG TPA: polysaccharide deacetylase family protein [Solirubrobacteraceae bacterium]|nr:polysaccharide deacetylase family protein [Solirubrobacteraceae bacterium]
MGDINRRRGGLIPLLAAIAAVSLVAGASVALIPQAARSATRTVANSPATPLSATPPLATPLLATPLPGGSPKGRPAPRVLYRPIGCLRRGPAIAYRAGQPRKVVALSFDDGPSADTPAFVSMLEKQHVPATFFMIGDQLGGQYRSTLHRELRNGDALGDHTSTHPDLELLSSGEVYDQLHRTMLAIRGLSGYTPCVFRPPYGDYDQSVIDTAESLGLATILWNVDPSDWAQPGVSAIEQRVLAQVQPGSIVISHDGGGQRGQTLAAYPYIIHALEQRGYRFETVPQLLGFHTVYRPCISECDGEGVSGPLPPGSVIQRGGVAVIQRGRSVVRRRSA